MMRASDTPMCLPQDHLHLFLSWVFMPVFCKRQRATRTHSDHFLCVKKSSALGQAFVTTHLKFAADQRALVIDSAKHGMSIQSCAPSIVQPIHSHSTPTIHGNVFLGNTRVRDKHHLQTTTVRFAGCTSDVSARQVQQLNGQVLSSAYTRLSKGAKVSLRLKRRRLVQSRS